MDNLKLDTSGSVIFVDGPGQHDYHWFDWSDLSPFTQGYVEALFADLSAAHHQRAGLKVGDKVRVHTEEVGTVARLIPGKLKCIQVSFADGGGQYFPFECSDAPLAFSDLAPETLARIMEDCALFQKPPADWVVFDFATGRDFWKDRQGRQLTRLSSQRFPPLTPYLGDDGKVYLREAGQ